MLLREIQVSAERPLSEEFSEVERRSQVLSTLVLKSRKTRLITPDFKKLVLWVNHHRYPSVDRKLLGICCINVEFDMVTYAAAGDDQRTLLLLDLICAGLDEACRRDGLDRSWVEEAREYATRAGFSYVFKGRKVKGSSGRAAWIEAHQGVNECAIYLAARNHAGKLVRCFVATDSPDLRIFQKYFHSMVAWAGDEVCLRSAERTVRLRVEE